MIRQYLNVILLLLLITALPAWAQVNTNYPTGIPLKHKTFLVLHSYGPDYAWTREVNEGIMSVLEKLDWTDTIRIEYMDSKNTYTEQYLEELAELYATKYQILHFDGIIATDNNALNFLERVGRQLFPVAVVVATGINGVDSIAKPTIARSVVIEKADHLATIRQALHQNPTAKTLHVIADSSTTGQAMLAEVDKLLPQLANEGIEIRIVPQMAFEDLLGYGSHLNQDDIIYMLPYLLDATNRSFRQGFVSTFLTKRPQLRIYGSWQFQIGGGMVGGRVLSGFRQGEVAAQSLISLLTGDTSVPEFTEPVTTYRDLYDYRVVRELGINLETLPENTFFINKPLSFYARHKQIILPSLSIIAILVIIVLLLLQNHFKQLDINRRDRAIIDLNREIIETQRELVMTLGEVIENHSKETGNHVKRVAKISRFLGEKAGLTNEELEILEAASPLHDVGKIGIAEHILHKPGKLSDKEFEYIKTHTTIGRDILKTSDRQLLASACSIAYQHHERWDGRGYPSRLKGEEINLFARITMLADIYDALSSDRSYKKAWSEQKVINYIRRNSAIFFDPRLVGIFLSHTDEIRALREKYCDDT